MSGSFVYTAICNLKQNPENKLNDFHSVLPYPLLGEYEVGLESVFYPFTWTNLRSDSWLEVIKTRDALTVFPDEMTEAAKNVKRAAEPWRDADLGYDTMSHTPQKQVLEYAFRIRVRAGYYHSIDDLVDSMRKRLADLVNRRKIYQITYEEVARPPMNISSEPS